MLFTGKTEHIVNIKLFQTFEDFMNAFEQMNTYGAKC